MTAVAAMSLEEEEEEEEEEREEKEAGEAREERSFGGEADMALIDVSVVGGEWWTGLEALLIVDRERGWV